MEPRERKTAKPFGNYVRERRVAAGLSLREVAEAVGISHVFLGEVERGVRGPLRPQHWNALVRKIPGMARDELARLAALSRPLEIDLANAPPHYQNLGLALARRFKRRDLSDAEVARLLKLLTREGDRDE
jgi:Helix-turn-helix domain